MAKPHLKLSTILIIAAVSFFLLLIGVVFFVTWKFGQKTNQANEQQLIALSRSNVDENQQVRRIRFTDQSTGESTEIFMDGTVKQYDRNGKLIKTGRRGFAETQQIFQQFEWLINNRQPIYGGKYKIEIETEEGTITVNPGGPGGGPVDDAIDFIDHTLNPTPTPVSLPTPTPPATAGPNPTATPDPSAPPDYETATPFTCADYYVSGKPLKISNIICGPDGN